MFTLVGEMICRIASYANIHTLEKQVQTLTRKYILRIWIGQVFWEEGRVFGVAKKPWNLLQYVLSCFVGFVP